MILLVDSPDPIANAFFHFLDFMFQGLNRDQKTTACHILIAALVALIFFILIRLIIKGDLKETSTEKARREEKERRKFIRRSQLPSDEDYENFYSTGDMRYLDDKDFKND